QLLAHFQQRAISRHIRLCSGQGFALNDKSDDWNDNGPNLVDIGGEMVGWILKKILGSKNQRELKQLRPIVHRINEFDEQYKSLSDEALRAKTAIWKEELAKIPELEDQWKRLDEILPEAFAVVKNAARRLKDRRDSFTVCDQPMTWDMVHFDVQLLG